MFKFNSIEEALEDIKAGKIIIVIDDEDRENEGDLLMAAEYANAESINFMATHGRGLICMPIEENKAKELNLHPMVKNNTDNHGTAFTVSIDHIDTTTGISAYERALTIKKVLESNDSNEFRRPGHIFPLIAKSGGVLKRVGHTEAAVDLPKLAGLKPAGVICEIMSKDGTMARTPELIEFAKEHHLKIITIADLVAYRRTKEKLVELALENARMVLAKDRERIRREEGRTIGAVHEVEEWLGLKNVVRMEAYDISNISGFESVGSMVVYEKGRPKRSDYRKFKIKWVQGPNDYASMEEVLTRRFTHESNGEFDSFARLPDLILMDGGRGQVNIAMKVLNELGISIPVCGMVKDDHHRTRGLYFNNVEIPIDTSGEGFRLITRIQDEAHRFAIEYHRSLRSREQVHSILDDIPGIGDTRRKALLRKFKSVENIRDASEEELAQTESMNARSARQVYEFFHKS